MTASVAPAIGWVPDDSLFGTRLAMIRQRMGWGNVKEAALACGVPVESWRNWERDGAHPRRLVEICTQIAHRTGCDFYWLVAGPRPGDQVHEDAPAGAPDLLRGSSQLGRRPAVLRDPVAA